MQLFLIKNADFNLIGKKYDCIYKIALQYLVIKI